MSTPIMPGAEPISVTEGSHGGVLLLHGYTGTPQQLRPWAEAFARAGFAVEAPLLPGHGTSANEMLTTQWSDYTQCAENTYKKLAERYQHVFVGGLCSGGSLAAWLALQHSTLSGLMIINGFFKPAHSEGVSAIQRVIQSGKQFFVWPTLPKQVEDPQAPPVLAYLQIPFAPMVSVEQARAEICLHLSEIQSPILAFTSRHSPKDEQDDTWFENVTVPVEHISLERSNHVATLDYDKEIIETRSIEFALALTKNEQQPSQNNAA